MPKFKFKVLAGQANVDGKTYGRKTEGGPYVESDKELDKIFPNKFQRLSEQGQVEELTVDEYVKQKATGEENAVGKIETFVPRGDENSVVKSEKAEAKDQRKAAAAKAEEDKKVGEEEGEEGDDGTEDVTDKFPAAGKSDLKVVYHEAKQRFFVLDADTGKKIKAGKLTSEKDVKSYLSESGKKSNK